MIDYAPWFFALGGLGLLCWALRSPHFQDKPAPAPPAKRGQPTPSLVTIAHVRATNRQVVTAIHREWKPEEVERCRLCPVCSASPASPFCLIIVSEHVTRAQAPLFSTHGRPLSPPMA